MSTTDAYILSSANKVRFDTTNSTLIFSTQHLIDKARTTRNIVETILANISSHVFQRKKEHLFHQNNFNEFPVLKLKIIDDVIDNSFGIYINNEGVISVFDCFGGRPIAKLTNKNDEDFIMSKLSAFNFVTTAKQNNAIENHAIGGTIYLARNLINNTPVNSTSDDILFKEDEIIYESKRLLFSKLSTIISLYNSAYKESDKDDTIVVQILLKLFSEAQIYSFLPEGVEIINTNNTILDISENNITPKQDLSIEPQYNIYAKFIYDHWPKILGTMAATIGVATICYYHQTIYKYIYSTITFALALQGNISQSPHNDNDGYVKTTDSGDNDLSSSSIYDNENSPLPNQNISPSSIKEYVESIINNVIEQASSTIEADEEVSSLLNEEILSPATTGENTPSDFNGLDISNLNSIISIVNPNNLGKDDWQEIVTPSSFLEDTPIIYSNMQISLTQLMEDEIFLWRSPKDNSDSSPVD